MIFDAEGNIHESTLEILKQNPREHATSPTPDEEFTSSPEQMAAKYPNGRFVGNFG